MKLTNKTMAVIAAGALLVGGAALAATNADAVHLALDSLLVASTKMSVANAILANPRPPANNREARVGPPKTMTTNEISGITVRNGVINIYLSPATGTDQGVVQYQPNIVQGKDGKRAVQYVCVSPNIADIAKIAPDCVYHAVAE